MSAAALAASMPPTNLSNKADKAATGAGAKRKAAGSRGVEALKKVNTASMNKLTSFFKPKDK
jgi:ribonuclease H2 subunit B